MIGVIIQARMGSSRLPGKTMMDVAGKPMLAHVLGRAQRIPGVEFVGIATTTSPGDDVIFKFADDQGVPVTRGSEHDVLDRVYQAAKEWGVSVIIRVTPDCPLLDSDLSGRVLEKFLQPGTGLDYVSNTAPPTFPDGLDTEVFSFSALERAWQEAVLPSEREHLTAYITKHPELFSLANFASETDYSKHRWTVDRSTDLEFVRSVMAGGGEDVVDHQAVLQHLAEHPEHDSLGRNEIYLEGYYRSIAADPAIVPEPRSLKRSHKLRKQAQLLIPSGSQTFSKGPTQFVQGVAPVFLERGDGSQSWDVDGNQYIDYIMGLGPVILGHNHPVVTEAVYRQIEKGVTLSLPHPLEVEVSQILVDLIPCAEMVRFAKNGSDATSGAVRAARAYTGRDIIACCGYHGWQDWYVGSTTRDLGVPAAVAKLTKPFNFNDIASLERLFDEHPGQIAAVIMEPVSTVLPEDDFLSHVRELAHREGALLIFDEVVTGFRLAIGGAQEYFGVEPDLACFGKAMGNGYPISAVVGRRDVMEIFDKIFFSFTYGGELVSLAAAKATINVLRERDSLPHIWRQGKKLQDGFNVLAGIYGLGGQLQCVGLAPHTVINFDSDDPQETLLLKSLLQQEVIKRGVLSAGYHNLCLSHTDGDIDRTLRVYRSALEVVTMALDSGNPGRYLEGEPVQPVFRTL